MRRIMTSLPWRRIGATAFFVLFFAAGAFVPVFAAERSPSGKAVVAAKSPPAAAGKKIPKDSSPVHKRKVKQTTAPATGKPAANPAAVPAGKRAPKQAGVAPKRVVKSPSAATKGKSCQPGSSTRSSSVRNASQAVSAHEKTVRTPSRKKTASAALRAFQPKVFGRKSATTPPRKGTRNDMRYAIRKPGRKVKEPLLDTPLSAVERDRIPKEPFSPDYTAVFRGDRHTLSQMEKEPPEMAVRYTLNDTASARLTLNSQDPQSPIYSPLKKDENISATGVYLDLKMSERLLLQIGGEHRSLEGSGSYAPEQRSTGASMGLNWKF